MSADRKRELLADTFVNLAARSTNPHDQLNDLRNAARLRPDDAQLAEAIVALERRIAASPVYVAIEHAVTLGTPTHPPEGRIFIEQPDGSLKPCDGTDLQELEERYPGFARNWRLPHES